MAFPLAILVRISVTDWHPGGWDTASSIAFAAKLSGLGVDLVDCSSGGLIPDAHIPTDDDYQLVLAKEVRHGANIATAAVGRITSLEQVEAILDGGAADAVFLGRELLRHPHWPLSAGDASGGRVAWPVQYERASAALSRDGSGLVVL